MILDVGIYCECKYNFVLFVHSDLRMCLRDGYFVYIYFFLVKILEINSVQMLPCLRCIAIAYAKITSR